MFDFSGLFLFVFGGFSCRNAARAECSAWEVEAGGPGQDHPQLQRELKTSLGYVRSCLKNKKLLLLFLLLFHKKERERKKEERKAKKSTDNTKGIQRQACADRP